MRCTFTFEYDASIYTDENPTPDEVAKRDSEEFNCGDLDVDDLNGYSVISIEVAPAREAR